MKLGTKVRMSMTEDSFKRYINKDSKVKDIGAGNGFISEYIRQKTGCQIYCSDVMDYMELDLPFTLIKDNKLPFEKKEFDIAIMNDVLHHMPVDVQSIMLKEATRIAKKVLIVETQRTLMAMILDTIFSRIQHINMSITYTHRKRNNWKRLFDELGIKFEEIKINRKF